MLHRTMPKNGDELSILGFGCMRLPVKNGSIDEADAVRLIRSAIDQGVNYVDTAWPYHAGESEEVLGRALQDGYRQKVKLATKLPSWMLESRADMDRFLNAQLKKLQTERIDYYLVHALNGTLWDNVERLGVCDFLDQAIKDGRIVNAGFSFHGLAGDFTRIVDAYPWVFCQIQYNYLDEDNQAGTAGLEYAASKGLGVIVMEPLRGGHLALPTPPPDIASIWNEASTRRTPAEWALRWIWNRPEVTVVLSGMNHDSQLNENLAIAATAHPGALEGDGLALVQRASQTYRELMKVSCTGCGYCMPCPANVAIPLCFEEFNTAHMFGNVEDGKFRYALRLSGELVDGEPGYASLCVECGQCMEKCPQAIPIPDTLAEVAALMEDDELAGRVAIAKQIFRIQPQ